MSKRAVWILAGDEMIRADRVHQVQWLPDEGLLILRATGQSAPLHVTPVAVGSNAHPPTAFDPQRVARLFLNAVEEAAAIEAPHQMRLELTERGMVWGCSCGCHTQSPLHPQTGAAAPTGM
ncbi:hypothetical protein [Streptacidiphilus sp. EB103A]|uniref:hypothetical protein n=1 Tax=Streptacidiphilus sp. EB103A TaxID=3156275 RepID=UPI0035186F17